jgi:hypothetical protein
VKKTEHYKKGVEAAMLGKSVKSNPYNFITTDKGHEWHEGFMATKRNTKKMKTNLMEILNGHSKTA